MGYLALDIRFFQRKNENIWLSRLLFSILCIGLIYLNSLKLADSVFELNFTPKTIRDVNGHPFVLVIGGAGKIILF